MYSIIDVETTGGRAVDNKITEIGIVLHDGNKIVDTYSTLINPEKSIPWNITRLTGITNKMVAEAPKFYEVAAKIHKMTENSYFVAHNAWFDYSFIREEYAQLGFDYNRKQICTIKLLKKFSPGLKSYSLGNLIEHFGIQVNARHRALDDALATAELFERMLHQNGNLVR